MAVQQFANWAAGYRSRSSDEWTKLAGSVSEPIEHQSAVLESIVSANGRTAFGAEHDLTSVRDINAFRKAVPIRDHVEFRPWLDRLDAGERRVLSADEPLLYLSSSGTTGDEKRIPVTRSYLRDCFLPFYFAAGSRVLQEVPEVLRRPDAALNLSQDPRIDGDDGRPHIGLGQLDYAGLGEEAATGVGNLAGWSSLPSAFAGADPLERAYLRLRWAAQHDVRCVIAVNPAIAAALPHLLTHWWPRLVAELAAGTLGGLPHWDPDFGRARALDRLADRRGVLRPADLWPRLDLLVSWSSYVAGLYMESLVADFGPNVRVLSAPIGSAEGPLAVPTVPGRGDGTLMIGSVLYEFVPADESLVADSATLQPHELAIGHRYHVVLSHIGGLYRCATRDIVEVTGFDGRTPQVQFVGRHPRHSIDHELSEPEILQAVAAACAATGTPVRNLTWRSSPAGHEAIVAFDGLRSADDVATFAMALEMALVESRSAYRLARSVGSTDPVRVRAVLPEVFIDEWRRRVEAGERMPRVKDRLLLPHLG
ncbi:GH3 family domain-containing protein [Kribbella sp. CA-294648]|uniref:GH3 family domain-containing protein n=1 Tax=Kribbella sp. CA-294648 TaxID=3239948 RepID=UPI003D8C3399